MTVCPLCQPADEHVLWRDEFTRVIHVDDAGYPGYCRVIWNHHVAELSDLPGADRTRLMDVVSSVEKTLRKLMSPAKINLASLGNQVPHLHWHVIPRFSDDAHFPDAIWSSERRQGARRAIDLESLRSALKGALGPG